MEPPGLVPGVCPKGEGGGVSEISLEVNEIFDFGNRDEHFVYFWFLPGQRLSIRVDLSHPHCQSQSSSHSTSGIWFPAAGVKQGLS